MYFRPMVDNIKDKWFPLTVNEPRSFDNMTMYRDDIRLENIEHYGSYDKYGNFSGGVIVTLPDWASDIIFYSSSFVAFVNVVDYDSWDTYCSTLTIQPNIRANITRSSIISKDFSIEGFPYKEVAETGKINLRYMSRYKSVIHGIANGWLRVEKVGMNGYVYPKTMMDIEKTVTGRWSIDRHYYDGVTNQRVTTLYFKNEQDRSMVALML